MRRIEIEPGTKFGRLVAMRREGIYWHCECECGAKKRVYGGSLRHGATKSCGCLVRECMAVLHRTHGHSVGGKISATYTTWYALKQRCSNPRNARFAQYGGRGISICDRWAKFEAFLADMGERPAGTTIDRIDPDGNYDPGNCRWATTSEQAFNRRCVIDEDTAMQIAWMVSDTDNTNRAVAHAFGVSISTVARIGRNWRPGLRRRRKDVSL